LYQAGTQMASGLATHRLLLGFENFRSLQIGPYLARCLDPAGRSRLAALYAEERDPYTRALHHRRRHHCPRRRSMWRSGVA
jgi:hypothetical protein